MLPFTVVLQVGLFSFENIAGQAMMVRELIFPMFVNVCLSLQNPSIETCRECVLKGLCCYLNEKPESLVKEFLVSYILEYESWPNQENHGSHRKVLDGTVYNVEMNLFVFYC